MASTAVYLYCIVKAARRPAARRIPPGLPGATTPEAVPLSRGQWLIAAEVPIDAYGPGRLERKLHDLAWVAEIAVAHEAVVEHFSRLNGATAIPLKLFTMFSSRARAIADLASRRRALDRVIRRVSGCEEWGLRVTGKPVAAAPVGGGRIRTAGRGPATGTAFLAARREARDAARTARGAATGAAAQAYSRLTRLARDSRLRDRPPEGGTNPPILEASFLVRSIGRARFKAEARRQAASCAAAGAQMTLTGPWPAYSFVSLEGRA